MSTTKTPPSYGEPSGPFKVPATANQNPACKPNADPMLTCEVIERVTDRCRGDAGDGLVFLALSQLLRYSRRVGHDGSLFGEDSTSTWGRCTK